MNEPANNIAIRVRGLSRWFGALQAVKSIDMDVERGRIYGFLGPNGSGKSTTIRLLCGLLKPSDGEVTVLGHEIPRDAEKLRRKIGYMTQGFSLYGDLGIRENLDFIADVYALRGEYRRQRIAECLEHYELDAIAGQRAGTLSGGQRQRLALAAAVLHEPDLLLLDEPTSAVDPQNRRDFWDRLFELTDNGTTILVSTHYMDEAERCHSLAILDRGRLVASGEPRHLMQQLPGTVIEIENRALAAIRDRLTGDAGIISMAMLGTRLRVLVRRTIDDPVAYAGQQLGTLANDALIEAARPSLEDVFVTSTLDEDQREDKSDA